MSAGDDSAAGRWRALALAMVLPFLAGIATYARHGLPDFLTLGDLALLEQCTLETLRGEQELGIGGRAGGAHPGPAFFLAAAPLYAATGHSASSLFVTALFINALSTLVIIFTLWRTERRGHVWLFLALLSGFFLQMGWRLESSWNPYVSLTPFICCLVLLGAVARGWWIGLPGAVLAGSFAVQCHLSYALPVALSALAALGLALIARPASPSVPTMAARPVRWLVVAGMVGLAVWWLPLREELRPGPGNLESIVQFFRQNQEVQSADHTRRAAAEVFGRFVATPLWAIVPRPPFGGRGLLAAVTVAQFALLLGAIILAIRRRRRAELYPLAFAVILAVALVIAVRHIVIPLDLVGYLIEWMSVGSVFVWYGIGRAAPLDGRGTRWAAGLLVAVWAVAGSYQLVRAARRTQSFGDTEEGRAAGQIVEQALAIARQHPGERLLVRQLDYRIPRIRAAVMLALSKQGAQPVMDASWRRVYVDARLTTDAPDHVLFLTRPESLRCVLPGPGLRLAASNAYFALLHRDVPASLRQERLAFSHPFTTWVAWGFDPWRRAEDDCGCVVVGAAAEYVVRLDPRRDYQLAVDLRASAERGRRYEFGWNGSPLGACAVAPGGGQRWAVRIEATRVAPTNSLVIALLDDAGQPLAGGAFAVRNVEFTAEGGRL